MSTERLEQMLAALFTPDKMERQIPINRGRGSKDEQECDASQPWGGHCRQQHRLQEGRARPVCVHSQEITANPTTDALAMAPHPGQSGSRHSCQKSLLR